VIQTNSETNAGYNAIVTDHDGIPWLETFTTGELTAYEAPLGLDFALQALRPPGSGAQAYVCFLNSCVRFELSEGEDVFFHDFSIWDFCGQPSSPTLPVFIRVVFLRPGMAIPTDGFQQEDDCPVLDVHAVLINWTESLESGSE